MVSGVDAVFCAKMPRLCLIITIFFVCDVFDVYGGCRIQPINLIDKVHGCLLFGSVLQSICTIKIRHKIGAIVAVGETVVTGIILNMHLHLIAIRARMIFDVLARVLFYPVLVVFCAEAHLIIRINFIQLSRTNLVRATVFTPYLRYLILGKALIIVLGEVFVYAMDDLGIGRSSPYTLDIIV